jgi:hypothetical protein
VEDLDLRPAQDRPVAWKLRARTGGGITHRALRG